MLFPAAVDQSPIQFGNYLLTECVGQGGMAVVYKASRQGPSGFAKTVVVKAMLPTLSAQREFVAMFSAEARLMAQLTHPNIVQVHDFGVVDGVPYLVMEYLPGRNLSQLRAALAAARMKLPVGAALAIARDMCHGLGFAHNFIDEDGKRRRVIHRDVSPSNVMVCRDGSVKLLDFGVAKIVGEFEFDVTQSLKGKYAYMAPEQVTHQPIDCRVDVFAAGVVLHEMLTGKRLFAANTELETLQRVSLAQVIAPSVDNREVPRALDTIVKRALARHPSARYPSCAELAEALETLDALAWPRKRVAQLVAELFAGDWQVTCDVCGKPVMPSAECQECGTRAPDTSMPLQVALEPASEPVIEDAEPALEPLMGGQTDRNPIDAELPSLPSTGASEPLPLPPPPVTPVPKRAPKMLPSESSRRRLQVVRTPVPPPMKKRQPIDSERADVAAGQIDTDKDVLLPMRIPVETPNPPKLFVVPKTEQAPPQKAPVVDVPPPQPRVDMLAMQARVKDMPVGRSKPRAKHLPSVNVPSPHVPSARVIMPSAKLSLQASLDAAHPPRKDANLPPSAYAKPMMTPSLFASTPAGVLATPRPVAPQPLFVMPPSLRTDPHRYRLPRPSNAPLYIVGLGFLAAVLFAVNALVSSPPRPDPVAAAPAIMIAPATVPQPVAAPIVTPLAAPVAQKPAPSMQALLSIASLPTPPVNAKPRAHHHEHEHEHVSRPRSASAPAMAQAAPVDERSVKEGRLVDPFAELK